MKVEIVSGEVKWEYLRKKIAEEAIEVLHAPNRDNLIEELADLKDVILDICSHEGISLAELEEVRLKKRKEKWWFEQGIIWKKPD